VPEGVVTLRISPDTGTLVSAENPEGIPEMFLVNHLPALDQAGNLTQNPETQASSEPIF